MKLNNCCFCINLRIGCIVIAVIGIILAIIGVGLYAGWASILGLIVAIAANCCLLYSAAYTKGSTKSRSITALVYIAFVLLSAIFLVIQAVLLCIRWAGSNGRSEDHAAYASGLAIYCLNILLDLYFALVAYSFYEELKSVTNINVVSHAWFSISLSFSKELSSNLCFNCMMNKRSYI